MKLAISGKGGVGKTTITALLSQALVDAGRDVLAVDADPAPCLADALSFPQDLKERLHPIAEMDELIEERTGAKPGAVGGFFSLNPKVDDIPDQYSIKYRGVRLLEMGSVDTGGTGCICPEAAMVKTLFTHLLFRKDDVLILDMYAGVEHLGRATVDFVDAMLVVAEPTLRSLKTAGQIKKLAEDIGLTRLWLIGNKIRNEEDQAFIEKNKPDLPILAYFPVDDKVNDADHLGIPVYDHVPELQKIAKETAQDLMALVTERVSEEQS